MFNEKLTERSLALYTQIFKLDGDNTLVQIYIQKYKQCDSSSSKEMLFNNAPNLIANNSSLINILTHCQAYLPTNEFVEILLNAFNHN